MLMTLFGLAGAAFAQRQPLPVHKSVELKEDGQRYTVEGRVKIAGDKLISVLKAATIEGLAEENVIELSGSLNLKANLGGKVVLDNVWIELAADAHELNLSDVQFRGGGIRCVEAGVRELKMFAISSAFDGKAGFSLTLVGGEVDLQQCSFGQAVTIKGLPIGEKGGNRADVELISARSMPQGLFIDGIKDVVVRNCDIAGELATISNWTKMTFDGNNVRTPRIEFALPVFGKFSSSAVIKNNDFHCDEITFKCPLDGDKLERFTLDHNWYRGLVDTKEIVAKIVADNTRFPRIGLLVDCKRTTKGRMGLGGTASR